MKKTFWTVAVALCGLASTCGQAHAQPAEGAGNAQNPPAVDGQKAALDKAMEDGRKAAEKMLAMTPTQRREWIDQMQEQQFKLMLTAAGLNDLEMQEKIVLFAREQSAARLKVREAAARLRDAMLDKKSTSQTLSVLLSTYLAATEAERERRDKADGDLREDLDLAANPRLDGMLQLFGVIGDAAWFTGGMISGMAAQAMLPAPGEPQPVVAQPAAAQPAGAPAVAPAGAAPAQ